MKRRDFIERSCFGCAAVLGLSAILEACTSQKHQVAFTMGVGKIEVKRSEFVSVKKEKTLRHNYLVIKPENLEFPIALYQVGEDEFKALYLQCTHQGCELNPNETMLVCPCHGAEFNTRGEVSQGPAEINLKVFTTSQDHETVFIQL